MIHYQTNFSDKIRTGEMGLEITFKITPMLLQNYLNSKPKPGYFSVKYEPIDLVKDIFLTLEDEDWRHHKMEKTKVGKDFYWSLKITLP